MVGKTERVTGENHQKGHKDRRLLKSKNTGKVLKGKVEENRVGGGDKSRQLVASCILCRPKTEAKHKHPQKQDTETHRETDTDT